MLKKVHRLTLNHDFRRVFKNGRNFEDKIIKLKADKNKKNIIRFGFVVSKKVAGKAHDRNLIKRRLRSAVRFLLPNLSPEFDVVVWPKKHIEELKYPEIVGSLEYLFKKSGIMPDRGISKNQLNNH